MDFKFMLFAAIAAVFILIRFAIFIARSRHYILLIAVLNRWQFNMNAERLLLSMRATDLQLTRVAYHEAGHALLCWLSPHSRRGMSVHIVSRNSGYVRHAWTLRYSGQPQNVLWDALMVYMAGAAAESLRFRQADRESFKSGCGDLQKAAVVAMQMRILCGTYEIQRFEERHTPLPSPKDDAEFDRFLMLCDETSTLTNIKPLLRCAYFRARSILSENSTKLDKLAAAALYERKLTGMQIRRLLGERVRH